MPVIKPWSKPLRILSFLKMRDRSQWNDFSGNQIDNCIVNF